MSTKQLLGNVVAFLAFRKAFGVGVTSHHSGLEVTLLLSLLPFGLFVSDGSW